MNPIFADTSFYIALLSPKDLVHQRAVELARNLRCRTVTTEFVLVEVANALSATSQGRDRFINLMQSLRNPAVTILPASSDAFARGVENYRSRRDKAWSLTDCISFVAMQEHRLTEALTADHHFAQAGFAVLLG